MKKQFLLFVAAIFISISSLMAQERVQRQSPDEKVKAAMEKLASFDLSKEKSEKVQTILKDFYTAQQTARQEMRAAGNVDREAMMTKNKELSAERDTKLKNVLTEEEYQKWINDIEPTLRPLRPAGATPAAAPAKTN
jgi:periplasmic protein CpxP/Spy